MFYLQNCSEIETFVVGSHLRLLLCIHFPNANVKSKILVADVREEKDGVCKSTGHMVHDEDFLLYVFGLSKVSIIQSTVFALFKL